MGTLGCAKEESKYTKDLGERLKDLRAGKGISQKEMAKRLGISRTYLSNIERGVNRVTVFLLEKYCNIFKMSPDEVLEYNFKEEGLSHALIMELERMPEATKKQLYEMARALSMMDIEKETKKYR